jgi:hypothetical protein
MNKAEKLALIGRVMQSPPDYREAVWFEFSCPPVGEGIESFVADMMCRFRLIRGEW